MTFTLEATEVPSGMRVWYKEFTPWSRSCRLYDQRKRFNVGKCTGSKKNKTLKLLSNMHGISGGVFTLTQRPAKSAAGRPQTETDETKQNKSLPTKELVEKTSDHEPAFSVITEKLLAGNSHMISAASNEAVLPRSTTNSTGPVTPSLLAQ